MLKKIISLVLALVLTLSIFTFPAIAAAPISVNLDGQTLTFDVPPQLINNRTMVPLRAIFEAMGAKVDWDGDTQTVTGTKDGTVVILKIGDTSPTINGVVVTIDQPGLIIDNRTLAPLRFVAEAFGGDVAWDGDTQTASITMGSTTPITPPATIHEPVQLPDTTTTPAPIQPTPSQPVNNSATAKAGNTNATISIDKTIFIPNEIITIKYSGFTEEIFAHYNVCIEIYEESIPATIEAKSFITIDNSGISGTVEFQMPNSPGTYEVRLFFFSDEAMEYIYATIPVSVSPHSYQSPQNVVGTWVWIDMYNQNGYYGSVGSRATEVYTFSSDGTYTLYKVHVSTTYMQGPMFSSGTESFIKGRYNLNNSQITFSEVQTQSRSLSANDKWQNVGYREHALELALQIPTESYSSTTSDSRECVIIDAETIGFGGNEAYGSDGYYHYKRP